MKQGSGLRRVGFLFSAFAFLCVAASLFERSIYGLALTSLFLFALMVCWIVLDWLLRSIMPLRHLTYVVLVPLFFGILFKSAFGSYLQGGDLFIGFTPLVVSGDVTPYGFAFVAGYTVVLATATYIATR